MKMRGDISCTCRMYKISGIPCCHIVSALRLEKNADQDPKTLISDWFTIEKLKTCYAYPLKPVNGMNMWKVTTNVRVNPPPFKKPPGRPPGKKRKRDKGEPREPPKISKRGMKIVCIFSCDACFIVCFSSLVIYDIFFFIYSTVGVVAKKDIIRCIARIILSQNHPRIDLEGHARK